MRAAGRRIGSNIGTRWFISEMEMNSCQKISTSTKSAIMEHDFLIRNLIMILKF